MIKDRNPSSRRSFFSKLARVASSTEIRPPNNSGQANSNGPSTDAIARWGKKQLFPSYWIPISSSH